MDPGGSKKIERPGGLSEETIPFSEGEGWVNSAKNGNEMIFKGSDGTFRGVDSVNVWWYQLIRYIVSVKRIA